MRQVKVSCYHIEEKPVIDEIGTCDVFVGTRKVAVPDMPKNGFKKIIDVAAHIAPEYGISSEYVYEIWYEDEPDEIVDNLIQKAKEMYEKIEIIADCNKELYSPTYSHITVWIKKGEEVQY